MQVALAAYAAFTVPHVAYHAGHPADALSGTEDVLNVLSLGSGLILAAVFAWGTLAPRPARAADQPAIA